MTFDFFLVRKSSHGFSFGLGYSLRESSPLENTWEFSNVENNDSQTLENSEGLTGSDRGVTKNI